MIKHINAILLVGVFALLPFFNAEAATKTVTGYTENQAEAYFSSVQGCEDVVVGVSVVKPTKIIPDAPLASTDAFIFGTFNNICDIGSSYSFADVVTLSPDAFDQNKLKNASLKVTTNIGGFDVAINLNWDGVGKKEKSKNKIRIVNEGIITRDSDVIASRATDISGSFTVNGIDYATGTETGGLTITKAHTVQIQK